MRRDHTQASRIGGARLLIGAVAVLVVLAGSVGSAFEGNASPSLVLAVATLLAFLYCVDRLVGRADPVAVRPHGDRGKGADDGRGER